jgi:hypothetical protein
MNVNVFKFDHVIVALLANDASVHSEALFLGPPPQRNEHNLELEGIVVFLCCIQKFGFRIYMQFSMLSTILNLQTGRKQVES